MAVVETYEIEEIKGEAETMAIDHEAIEIVERLGLEGQKTLSNKVTVTRMPYPEMTDDQEFVFSILFPEKQKIEEYDSGIIPIRVLQVIAFCKDNHFFDSLRIWHSAKRKDKDPVLVGYIKDKETSWREKSYVLARWGDALLPFEELMAQAKVIAYGKLKMSVAQVKSKVNSLEAQVNSFKDPQEAPMELLRKTIYLSD